MRRLFYTSPVDHHSCENWPKLAQDLQRAVVASCDGPVSFEIAPQPVFAYGTDIEEALAAIEEQHPVHRGVRIELWCSICCYAAVCLTLGEGIRRKERRALMRRLKKGALGGETFLREHQGPYYLDSGQVYGYSLNPEDDRDRSTLAGLLDIFDRPVYLGEYWLLQGGDERLDTKSFELISRIGPHLALFVVNDLESAERVWAASTRGDGLIVLEAGDPAEPKLKRRFAGFQDLAILLAEAPSTAMRLTVGRCHKHDSLVVVYGSHYAAEIDESILFVI